MADARLPLRVLILGPDQRGRVDTLLAYARDPEHWYDARDRSDGWMSRVPGFNDNLRLALGDYRCVFSFTIDRPHDQLYRHLSISVPSKNYPAPEAVAAIARAFGFTGEADGPGGLCRSWSIRVSRGGVIDDNCIIVVQPEKRQVLTMVEVRR